jgi:hypothetical protein
MGVGQILILPFQPGNQIRNTPPLARSREIIEGANAAPRTQRTVALVKLLGKAYWSPFREVIAQWSPDHPVFDVEDQK